MLGKESILLKSLLAVIELAVESFIFGEEKNTIGVSERKVLFPGNINGNVGVVNYH